MRILQRMYLPNVNTNKVSFKNTQRSFFMYLLILTLLVMPFYLFLRSLKPYAGNDTLSMDIPPDSLQYLTGAHIIKSGKIEQLYDTDTQVAFQKELSSPKERIGLLAFRTPPTTALLYLPLTYLSYQTAFVVTVLINVILLSLTVFFIFKSLKFNARLWYLVPYFLLLYMPISGTIKSMQLSILIAFLISFSFYQIKRERLFLAGLALGLLFLKPQFLLFAPMVVFLIKKDRALFIKGFLYSFFALVSISTLAYGWKFVIDYPRFLLGTETISHGTKVTNNLNVSSLISLLTNDHHLINLWNVFINSALLTLLFLKIKQTKTRNLNLAFSSLVILTPTLNIHTMSTDTAIFIFPIYAISDYLYKRGSKYLLVIFLLFIFGVPWLIHKELAPIITLAYLILGFSLLYDTKKWKKLYSWKQVIK